MLYDATPFSPFLTSLVKLHDTVGFRQAAVADASSIENVVRSKIWGRLTKLYVGFTLSLLMTDMSWCSPNIT